MTLKEIAREAGVSISTVSRVLNQPGSKAAGKEVREKIWDEVRAGGYTPNAAARELKQTAQKEHIMRPIHCLIACAPGEVKDDPFFAQLISSVEQEAFLNHFVLKYTYSMLDMENPEVLRRMQENSLDSLIIIGRFQQELLDTLKRKFKRIVYVGVNNLEADCDQVICDGYGAARLAVRHLQGLGHRHIGYIGEKDAEARYRGYYDAMQDLRLPLCRPHVVDAPQSVQGGHQGAMRLLTAMPISGEAVSTPPSAIFCANDLTAVGVLQALRERGVRVPGEISVISIDNTEMAQNTVPMLTAIDIPKEDLGRFAVKLLADRMAGGHRLPVKLEVPYTLITRASTSQAEPGRTPGA